MKSFIFFSIILLYSSSIYSQSAIEISKTEKIKKNGIELITYQGQVFSGFITENFPNGKPKAWFTTKNGLADGLWQEWFENGKLKYCAYGNISTRTEF
jgi:antitoxin component YwqK of YwqJK toxin-antitoxin module